MRNIDIHSISLPAVSPSLLSADKNNLLAETLKMRDFGASLIHVDVMDGIFVPNTNFSLDTVKEVSQAEGIIIDTHIMVINPLVLGPQYAKNGSDIVTFHFEACQNEEEIHRTIKAIRDDGAYVGLSIKPNTSVEKIKPFKDEIDLFLLMSVEPGAGGQPFIEESLERLLEAKDILKDGLRKPLIEIDGGINGSTGPASIKNGADILVAGSYLFGHDDAKERIEGLLCR